MMAIGQRLERTKFVTVCPGFCYAGKAGVTVCHSPHLLPRYTAQLAETYQLSLATPDLRRGIPKRCRRSHRHLRLTPNLRASSVSVM